MIRFDVNGDSERGYLSFFDSLDIQFEIKRIYYIYNVSKGICRGKHAHKQLNQILWCPYGSIEVELDNGYKKEKFFLDHPSFGLFVLKGIWHEMIWKKKNSVLCVAASDYYNEDDYIRNYDEFLMLNKQGYWKE